MKMIDYINSLEYINLGLVILSGILFLLVLGLASATKNEVEKKRARIAKKKQSNEPIKKEPIYLSEVLIGLFFISTFTLFPYMQYMTVLENIESFRSGKVLTCGSGFGIYSSGSNYMVFKDGSWSTRGDKFYNEKTDQLINAINCKEQ